MRTFTSLLYPPLIWIARHTARRGYLRELQEQSRFRKRTWIEQAEYARREAVSYANYMAQVSPGYREFLRENGVLLPIPLDQPDAWNSIPTLRKSNFQTDPSRWVNEQLDSSEFCWSNTSGSSGEPFGFPETGESWISEVVSFELSRREIGWRAGEPEGLIKITPPRITGLRRLVKKALGTLPVAFSAIEYRYEDTERIVKAFNSANVQLLRSFPTVLLLLAEDMLRKGLRCHIPRIIVFGEGLSPSRSSIIEEAFAATVYRDYGGSEAMHIGFQCSRCSKYRLDLYRFFVEVLDGDEPVGYGREGEIVVTCFRNGSFPFVRYRMGDIGVMLDPSNHSPCGAGGWHLDDIRGRVIDVIHAPNGLRLDAAFLVVVMEYTNDDVLAYKFIQRAPDLIELQYVPRRPQARENLRVVEEKILSQVRGAMRLTISEVKEIPSEASGKRKILVPLKQEWKTSVE